MREGESAVRLANKSMQETYEFGYNCHVCNSLLYIKEEVREKGKTIGCPKPSCYGIHKFSGELKPYKEPPGEVLITGGTSDGSSAEYYNLPTNPPPTQLQDLISHRDMNAQMGEIFRATYRYGMSSHSDKMRDAKKIKFYIEAEIARLERLQENT